MAHIKKFEDKLNSDIKNQEYYEYFFEIIFKFFKQLNIYKLEISYNYDTSKNIYGGIYSVKNGMLNKLFGFYTFENTIRINFISNKSDVFIFFNTIFNKYQQISKYNDTYFFFKDDDIKDAANILKKLSKDDFEYIIAAVNYNL